MDPKDTTDKQPVGQPGDTGGGATQVPSAQQTPPAGGTDPIVPKPTDDAVPEPQKPEEQPKPEPIPTPPTSLPTDEATSLPTDKAKEKGDTGVGTPTSV